MPCANPILRHCARAAALAGLAATCVRATRRALPTASPRWSSRPPTTRATSTCSTSSTQMRSANCRRCARRSRSCSTQNEQLQADQPRASTWTSMAGLNRLEGGATAPTLDPQLGAGRIRHRPPVASGSAPSAERRARGAWRCRCDGQDRRRARRLRRRLRCAQGRPLRRFGAAVPEFPAEPIPNGATPRTRYYWLGESYYVTQNYAAGAAAVPDPARPLPDPRQGARCAAEARPVAIRPEQMDAAETHLVATSSHAYPGTDAARTADDRLRAIQLSQVRSRTVGRPRRDVFRRIPDDHPAPMVGQGPVLQFTHERRFRRHRCGRRIGGPPAASPRSSCRCRAKPAIAGWPTVFVRLTGCPLRCQYCDTAYAFHGGEWRDIDDILAEVAQPRRAPRLRHRRRAAVAEALPRPAARLCDAGYDVSLETSGAIDIAEVDPRVSRVLDIKTPGSARGRAQPLGQPAAADRARPGQVRAVRARGLRMGARCRRRASACPNAATCCFRPASPNSTPRDLADWIVADRLPVRFQMQLHKLLWNDEPGR